MRTISFDVLASPSAQQARLARINASHASACALHTRRARYYPAVTSPLGYFTTTDRPTGECAFPNAGRDVIAPAFNSHS